jgi:3,2-trans-enoyl-CoA isomerase
LVFSSSNPSILSAGIDFTELYNPNDERLPKFWYSFQQLFLDLYGSRLAIVGAIEGHAPAGGCMLAMACDYRVMAASSSEGKSSGMIGLNESQFGIVAPPFMAQLMLRTVGFREGEKALSLGKLYSSEEALEIGLVDDIVDRDLVLDASLKKATEFAKVPSHARFGSKMLARKPFIDDLIATRDEDVSNFCNFVKNDGVQKGLGAYLDKLKQRK